MMEERDRQIVHEILEENQEGLKRLAEEGPAEERRSLLKQIMGKIESFFEDEDKVGHISA
ncbi:MAG: hypothetical protein SV186_07210 [Candidatus Nanohaloarchaea archaeon]|nr:hypothetical protein [Candidatus Nanohaloarchaea archaeon]